MDKIESAICVCIVAVLVAMAYTAKKAEAYAPQFGRWAVACSTYGDCVKMDTSTGALQRFDVRGLPK